MSDKREIVTVCLACGKLEGAKWWDVSCVINSQKCYRDKLVIGPNGRVKQVLEGGFVQPSLNSISSDKPIIP